MNRVPKRRNAYATEIFANKTKTRSGLFSPEVGGKYSPDEIVPSWPVKSKLIIKLEPRHGRDDGERELCRREDAKRRRFLIREEWK